MDSMTSLGTHVSDNGQWAVVFTIRLVSLFGYVPTSLTLSGRTMLKQNLRRRLEWKWEGVGMSYREQYGNGNGFYMRKFREWELN